MLSTVLPPGWVPGAFARALVIHAGTLLDGVTDIPREHVSIVVDGNTIVRVDSGFTSPSDSDVLDLSTSTVMPGFIDCHVHLSARLPGRANSTEYWLTHTDIDRALDAAEVARQMLQQGFTSARDVGGGDETVAVRNAINAGTMTGPRLWVSLEPLGPTGGHSDPRNGLDPQLAHPGWENGIIDSPKEAWFRVREHRRRGADLIKIMVSGGLASSSDDPNRQLMTNEEIRSTVEAAHSLGMKVAAHVYPSIAIENAVRAGVDSIEHGSFATAETLSLMKSRGTFLVPTLTNNEVLYNVARDHPELLAPGSARKILASALLPKRNLLLAIRSKVKIAYGTDIGEGDHTQGFDLLISNGMPVAQALSAATRIAAELIGAEADIGTVQPGHYADLVATQGNPLVDPQQFRHVSFVMKSGVIYRLHGTQSAN
jgi:imidazolonepropionase-like amidohydrolase